MKTRVITHIVFLAVGAAFGLLAANAPHLLARQNKASWPGMPSLPKAPVSYPNSPVLMSQGTPAMRPTKTGSVPAYSADELRQFLDANPLPLGIKSAQKVRISRVDCGGTAATVSSIVHGRTWAISPETPVCYAEFEGDFVVPLPPSPVADHKKTLTFHKAFRVYDAKTGNLMAAGAF